jgi:hypothetical protein
MSNSFSPSYKHVHCICFGCKLPEDYGWLALVILFVAVAAQVSINFA